MKNVQRLIACGAVAVASAGIAAPAAHAATVAPAAQAAQAAPADACAGTRGFHVIPVPKSRDPRVKLKLHIVPQSHPDDGERYAAFRVLYCANKVDIKHLTKGEPSAVVLTFTITNGRKTLRQTCKRGQYFWRASTSPRPWYNSCHIDIGKDRSKWRGTASLSYDVATDKAKPFTFKTKANPLKFTG
ncbi:hypothetical protein GCM10009678_91840 [Actinomadura kijaniata]|uniref:Secreted protein n=1 Tax=Actinomadura namibiensis TaxID=182080 RepID=A0A7W3LZN0_ACTNM|nr:hypothetical protein [Actinomadura namibiensis]MBA8957288.1 hypothetical protein [Actinomadura namibiensis]